MMNYPSQLIIGYFFAGEATHCKYPSTVYGAYLSGLRAADLIKKER